MAKTTAARASPPKLRNRGKTPAPPVAPTPAPAKKKQTKPKAGKPTTAVKKPAPKKATKAAKAATAKKVVKADEAASKRAAATAPAPAPPTPQPAPAAPSTPVATSKPAPAANGMTGTRKTRGQIKKGIASPLHTPPDVSQPVRRSTRTKAPAAVQAEPEAEEEVDEEEPKSQEPAAEETERDESPEDLAGEAQESRPTTSSSPHEHDPESLGEQTESHPDMMMEETEEDEPQDLDTDLDAQEKVQKAEDAEAQEYLTRETTTQEPTPPATQSFGHESSDEEEPQTHEDDEDDTEEDDAEVTVRDNYPYYITINKRCYPYSQWWKFRQFSRTHGTDDDPESDDGSPRPRYKHGLTASGVAPDSAPASPAPSFDSLTPRKGLGSTSPATKLGPPPTTPKPSSSQRAPSPTTDQDMALPVTPTQQGSAQEGEGGLTMGFRSLFRSVLPGWLVGQGPAETSSDVSPTDQRRARQDRDTRREGSRSPKPARQEDRREPANLVGETTTEEEPDPVTPRRRKIRESGRLPHENMAAIWEEMRKEKQAKAEQEAEEQVAMEIEEPTQRQPKEQSQSPKQATKKRARHPSRKSIPSHAPGETGYGLTADFYDYSTSEDEAEPAPPAKRTKLAEGQAVQPTSAVKQPPSAAKRPASSDTDQSSATRTKLRAQPMDQRASPVKQPGASQRQLRRPGRAHRRARMSKGLEDPNVQHERTLRALYSDPFGKQPLGEGSSNANVMNSQTRPELYGDQAPGRGPWEYVGSNLASPGDIGYLESNVFKATEKLNRSDLRKQAEEVAKKPEHQRTPEEQALLEEGQRRLGHIAGTGTFCMPEYDSDEDDSMLDEDVTSPQKATEPSEAAAAPSNLFKAAETTTQPPPAPTPAHAELPTSPAQPPTTPATLSEREQREKLLMEKIAIERARAKASKHKPSKPSRLQEMSRLSSSPVTSQPQTPIIQNNTLSNSLLAQDFATPARAPTPPLSPRSAYHNSQVEALGPVLAAVVYEAMEAHMALAPEERHREENARFEAYRAAGAAQRAQEYAALSPEVKDVLNIMMVTPPAEEDQQKFWGQ